MDIKINSNMDNGVLTFEVIGRLDSFTAPEMNKAIKEEAPEAEQIVFDFNDLEYISSAGIRSIVGAIKMVGTDNVSIINANASVVEVFELVGMLNFIQD